MSMTFFYLMLIFLAMGLPIVFALGLSPLFAFVLAEKWNFLNMVPQRIFAGINQFPLLAIPLFILAGEIMNHGGITERLVNFSNALFGHFRGGLAQVNIFTSILFAGLSGSAVADTSALGSMLIPAMEKDGYTAKFAAAVTAASSVIGPIIPPSIIMIIYAFVMKISVAALFMAGMIPGLLLGIGLMIMTTVLARRRNYAKAEKRASIPVVYKSFKRALWPLLTPVIIIGGILGGVFTPTESAAAAVAYAFFLSLFGLKQITFRSLPSIFYRTAITSGTILLIIGTACLFGWIATVSQVPQKLSVLLLSFTENQYTILFLVNVFLLIVGMFLDAGPAILILGPILSVTMTGIGIHPLHFAIVMCVNVTVGLATPPMGMILFVASGLTKLGVEEIAKEMMPYLAVHFALIAVITYIPEVSLFLPRILGFLE